MVDGFGYEKFENNSEYFEFDFKYVLLEWIKRLSVRED